MRRAKKNPKNKPKNILDLSDSQAAAVSLLISVQTEKGMRAFVTAGSELLMSEYGFTSEQAAKWATKTIETGMKYLKSMTSDKTIYESNANNRITIEQTEAIDI